MTQRLLHPKYKIEKEYVATVVVHSGDGNNSNDKDNSNDSDNDNHKFVKSLKQKLEVEGVVTGEGTHYATLVDVEQIDVEKSRTILKNYLTTSSQKRKKSKGGRGKDGGSIGSEENDNGNDNDTYNEKDDQRVISAVENDEPLFNIKLIVQEGKYRMVRRMLANCGHPVVELKRERHGLVKLKDLGVGEFRDCTEDELDWAEGLLK